LLSQIVGAQAALEAAIAELSQSGGNPAQLSESRSQLALLGNLSLQLGTASGAALANLRGEVMAVTSTANSTAQQTRAAANAANAASADIAQLAAISREQVTSIMRDMKDFDPYLHFDSKAEEEAYRRREVERQQAIAAELAKNTPAGDMNAAGVTVGQMVDAKAHGAGNSPEFDARWHDLVTTTTNLRNAMRAQGQSTDEFDRKLRDDLRTIMKSKGLTDAQIDERFAKNSDPLEAAKAYVGETEMQHLTKNVAVSSDLKPTQAVSVESVDTPLPKANVDDVMAKFRATGVTVGEHPPEGGYTHGVNATAQTATSRAK
jgi:hypothetical protein